MKKDLFSKTSSNSKVREKPASTDKSFLSHSLAKEITVILIVKLMVVFIIKWQFFSEPVDLNEVNLSVEAKLGVLK